MVAVDGAPVADADDLVTTLAATAPGADLDLVVVRGADRLDVTVTVGQRPALVD